MDLPFLLKGLVIGFSIAAPVGPIGVLCIRRTLAEGLAAGFLSGLGAATADAFYGSIAGFGLTFISGLLIHQQGWFSLAGGLFLCYLGVRTLRAAPVGLVQSPGGPAPAGRLARAYASTLALTLTNPATILSFSVVFAGLGLGAAEPDYSSAGVLVLGVFSGSALWWLFLSGGVSLWRRRLDARWLARVNRLSGLVIITFGLLALLNLLR